MFKKLDDNPFGRNEFSLEPTKESPGAWINPGDAKWIYLSDGKADWFAKYSLYEGLKDFLNS